MAASPSAAISSSDVVSFAISSWVTTELSAAWLQNVTALPRLPSTRTTPNPGQSRLMVAGIALLGVVTATRASWLVERVSAENASERAATAAQVDALLAEVRALRQEQAGHREQ